mmetsp:Transcript_11006/g.24975  ORF Transcript_11006/g.24975 Transcript_11006/m.24975 type:complete len:303 (-) Transcript_11006:83-991(-)
MTSENLLSIEPFQVPVNPDGTFKCFGQGTSGTVTRAIDTRSGNYIALKAIPVQLREQDRENVIQQLQNLYSCQHPCVTEFLGCAFYPARSSILIACEYMDLKSFKDLMTIGGAFPEEVVGYASSRLLDALVYLHRERKMIHRDIKPSNLLMSSKGQIKICDFGMSTQLANTLDPAHTWVGSTTYMSPERISGLQYVWNSDIWSLGISLAEVATGRFPYSDPGRRLELVELLDRIVDEDPPTLPETFSPEFRDFVSQMLVKRAEQRPHAEMLIGHPFVVLHSNADISQWLQQAAQAMPATQPA